MGAIEPDRSRGGASERRGAPSFRLWPPIAVAVPWFVGYAAERALGSPIGIAATQRIWVQVIGWCLVAVFVVWNAWCLVLFARHRTGLLPGQSTSNLLTTGPYRFSRNPLYVGLLVLHAGAAMAAVSVGALTALPLAWAGLHWGAVLPEERYLRDRIGSPYLEYCRTVRRWV